MTTKLYNKLTSTYSTDKTPALIERNNLDQTISLFNNYTSAGFNICSEAQWEFAAKGGVKSMGYTYSGSNNIDEVAWYKSNSDDKLHEVKGKLHNELGLYDMSGNAREFVLDYYNPFTEEPVTNPISTIDGKEGHTMRGGHFGSEAKICASNYRYYYYVSVSTSQGWVNQKQDTLPCAVRLALNWN